MNSSPWLSFQSWLEQQRSTEDAAEGVVADGTSLSHNIENVPLPEAAAPSVPPPQELSSSASSQDQQQHPQQQQRLAPSSSLSSALARDCRTETRLLDGSARGRQDMTIMLAAPGMPLHNSPLITTRQATSLLNALCEPLVQISVGRLSRKLESPTVLHPTRDRGVLSLWLLPNDDLSLVWQGRIADAAAPASSSSSSSAGLSQTTATTTTAATAAAGNKGIPESNTTTSTTTAAQDVERGACEVTVWEELARFPSGAHPGSPDPIVTIHMLRGDPSGRSFYIRGGVGTAFHSVEAMVNNNVIDRDADELEGLKTGFDGIEDCRRMYFWLTGPQLSTAVRSLGRLKSLVKRPPTLSKRSGVPLNQLRMISSWMQQLDVIANQQAAALAAQNEHVVDEEEEGDDQEEEGNMSSQQQQQLPPSSTTTTTTTPTTTSGSGVSAAATAAAAVAGTAAVQHQENGRLSVSGAVSATAAAVYRDRRFHISFPCTVTVGASVALSCSSASTSSTGNGGGVEAAVKELSARATQDAKIIAEDVARRTVDRMGRRNLEEAICESFIRNVRTQRAKIKADARVDRDQKLRRLRAIQAQPLIQKAVEHATARGGLPSTNIHRKIAFKASGDDSFSSLPPSSLYPPAIDTIAATNAAAGLCSSAALPLCWEESSRRSGSAMSSTDSDAPGSPHSQQHSRRTSGGGGGGGSGAAASTSVVTSSIAAGSDGECEDTAISSASASEGGDGDGGAAAMKESVKSTTGNGVGVPSAGAPGRVTIANLESLLNSSSKVHHTSEHAPVDQFKVTIADLPDLLQAPPQQQQQQQQ